MTKQIELPALSDDLIDDLAVQHLGNPGIDPTNFARAIIAAAIAKHEEDRVVGEPVAWLVCSTNSDGTSSLEYAAPWQEAAHEHINDAITEHGIEDAASWVVRPAYLAAPPAPLVDKADDMRQRLQKQCSAWGTYWRASDSHGVELTMPQAVELLENALGVEVEIKHNGCTTCDGNGMIGGPSYYSPDEGGVPCPDCAAPVAQPAAEAEQAEAPSDARWWSPPDSFAKNWLTNGAALHPLTVNLVVRFARALATKLAAAEVKYGYSDGWRNADWMDECRAKLAEHVAKGDPRDVAAYCAFLWHHGESTVTQSTASEQAEAPKVDFEDPRVQTVYRILCSDDHPEGDEHWEGFAARRIVEALATQPTASNAGERMIEGVIAHLKDIYGISAAGRGIRSFAYVVDFVRAVEDRHGIVTKKSST